MWRRAKLMFFFSSKESIWIANRYVKRYSKLLIVRKIHIKATMRHHLMAIGIYQKGKKKKKKSVAEDVDIVEINVLPCWWVGKKKLVHPL